MKSILVIGMGNLGSHLATKMLELGNDVMIVDKNDEIIAKYSSVFTDSHIGDCTNKSVIKSLGVNNFDICFVTIGDDFQSSLEITYLLKEMDAKFVVSKAKSEKQEMFLLKLGADEVIYPEKEMAEKLATRYNTNNVFDYIELTNEYSICEIDVPHQWVSETIGNINVRKKYKINILAVKNENTLKPLPGADYIFNSTDHIVVLGKSSDVFKLAPKT